MFSESFLEFLPSNVAQVVIALAVIAIVSTLGLYLIGKLRGELRENEPEIVGSLTNFREMHAQGVLSDAEYRTIKAMLAERAQQRLKATTPNEAPASEELDLLEGFEPLDSLGTAAKPISPTNTSAPENTSAPDTMAADERAADTLPAETDTAPTENRPGKTGSA